MEKKINIKTQTSLNNLSYTTIYNFDKIGYNINIWSKALKNTLISIISTLKLDISKKALEQTVTYNNVSNISPNYIPYIYYLGVKSMP